MFVEKEKVLSEAPDALNRPDQPWEAVVEDDRIIARWKWMDATFFAPNEVSDETRQYTFAAILDDRGKWRESDKIEEKSVNIKMSDGNLTVGGSSGAFIGKTHQKSIRFGIGRNNQTGEVGIVGFKFNTASLKQPIRDYLASRGWKKAGLFG